MMNQIVMIKKYKILDSAIVKLLPESILNKMMNQIINTARDKQHRIVAKLLTEGFK